ncbi:MAG TPA: YdjY domain-containing protein, partial [Urbifossiella sp.]|nr:YdjY domain-containing protein [Urbifossiella sp.]
EGPLEVFVCKRGTKEHEAVLRVDLDASKIHELLLFAGAETGTPTQFVDPRTSEPKFKAATGTPVKVLVHYRKDGKAHTHPAQEWVWNTGKKRSLEVSAWVFAGSQFLKDPDRPDAPPFYAANSGEVVALSNFAYSMLEVPMEISKDDAQLNYEAKTDRIPPLFSRVWVILEPTPAKK